MKFTPSHEWICTQGNEGVVGITDYAQRELGQIVYIELPPVGKKVKAGEEVAVIESTKAAADIYSPVTGEVIAINQTLCDFVDQVNRSAEKEGWLFKIRLDDPDELNALLDKESI